MAGKSTQRHRLCFASVCARREEKIIMETGLSIILCLELVFLRVRVIFWWKLFWGLLRVRAMGVVISLGSRIIVRIGVVKQN